MGSGFESQVVYAFSPRRFRRGLTCLQPLQRHPTSERPQPQRLLRRRDPIIDPRRHRVPRNIEIAGHLLDPDPGMAQ